MEKDIIKISFDNFIVAQISLNDSKSTYRKIKVEIPPSCSLYHYIKDRKSELSLSGPIGGKIDNSPQSIEIWGEKIYLIKDSCGSLPLGYYFADLGKGISFQVSWKINGNIFIDNLPSLPWKYLPMNGNVAMLYIPEYFIDQDEGGIQKGLSIFLRDLIKGKIQDQVKRLLVSENPISETEMISRLTDIICHCDLGLGDFKYVEFKAVSDLKIKDSKVVSDNETQEG